MIDLYYEKTIEAINKVHDTQKQNIAEAGRIVANTIKGDGMVQVFGTGHSHILAIEMYGRAGGLVPVNPILESNLMMHEGMRKSSGMERLTGYAAAVLANVDISKKDTMIVISQSGRNAVPIEMAMEAKKRSLPTIAITSLAHAKSVLSRHPSGKRLFEIADLVIDNCTPIGDACIPVEGTPAPIAPLSTITGTFILHSIACAAVSILVAEGVKPPVFISANSMDGEIHNLEMFQKYRGRVKF